MVDEKTADVERAELTALDEVARLERSLEKTRREALKQLRRRVRGKEIPPPVREQVYQKFANGEMLTSIRAWLKREHGIEVSVATLHNMRAQFLGRRFPKEALAEIERIEAAVDPLRRLAELLERIEARYKAHVEMEQQIGVLMDKPAVEYLKLFGETNMMILEALEKLGVITPKKQFEVKHNVADEAFEEVDGERLRRMVARLLAKWADHGSTEHSRGTSRADTD